MADEVKRVRVELDVVAVGADKAKTEIDNAAQNRTVNVGSGVASGGAAVGGGGGGSVRSAGSRSQQEANAQWFADDASGTGLLRYASDNPNGSRAQRDLRQEIQGARAWQQTVFSDQDRQMAGFERQESRIQSARIANRDRYGMGVSGSAPAASPLRAIPAASPDSLESLASAAVANIMGQAGASAVSERANVISRGVRDRYGRSVSSAQAAAAPLRAIPRPTSDTAAESIINSIQRNSPIEATKQGALEAERYLAEVASDNANIEQIQEWGLNTPRSQPQRAPLAGPSARQPGSGGGAGRGRGGLFGNIQVRGLAAIYAGYRFAEAEAEDYKRYQMADALGKAGYGGEATEALYQNAKDVATDPWKRLAVTMQNYTTAFTGVAGIASADKYGGDPEQRLRDAEQAMIATHSAGVGMTRNANIASMRQSMGTSAYAAQNAWIQDPIQAAQFGQDLAGRQAGDANDAAVRELTAKMTPDLNPVERGKLAYDIVAKLGQRSTEMDQARAAKEPEIAGATRQQWFNVQQSQNRAWANRGEWTGDPAMQIWGELNQEYQPRFNAASGSDRASRELLAQETQNYKDEFQKRMRPHYMETERSLWAPAVARANITGDYATLEGAAWQPYNTAMKYGTDPNSLGAKAMYAQSQAGGIEARAAGAAQASYAADSAGITAASGRMANFEAMKLSADATLNAEWAKAHAADPSMSYDKWINGERGQLASNAWQQTTQAANNQWGLFNIQQEGATRVAGLQASFKPVEAQIEALGASVQQQLYMAGNEGQKAKIRTTAAAQFAALGNQWLMGSSAGNFAEGMWFQPGTGGNESGYQGINEVGRALKSQYNKMNGVIDYNDISQ